MSQVDAVLAQWRGLNEEYVRIISAWQASMPFQVEWEVFAQLHVDMAELLGMDEVPS